MLASRMDALLREKLVPFFTSSPNVRIASVSGDTPAGEAPDREGRRPADGLDRADEMIQVLRSIGFVR
jgi:phospholipid/cholesterol/gamma-HCH transport system substrate-binding protein